MSRLHNIFPFNEKQYKPSVCWEIATLQAAWIANNRNDCPLGD